ncbi:hypothetical protein TNCV_2133471 [Trichonephila clavipes]|nr:hypothetical protein TNCV_2133471 [Trichonephila clavipes]
MEWPACSPDINPIEHVWDALGRRVAGRQIPPHPNSTRTGKSSSGRVGQNTPIQDSRGFSELANDVKMVANDVKRVANDDKMIAKVAKGAAISKNDANLALPPRFC